MKKFILKLINQLNKLVSLADRLPLWWIGLILAGIIMVPFLRLGEGSVFLVHDQMDESMMNYVLTARHLGESVFPEMMGGINAGGLQPSAVLFMLLYRALPPFWAFLCTYIITFLCGFFGMYLAVRKLTESSILATAAAGVFCMLPFYIVYGLSQMGIPLMLYAYLCLREKKKKAISLFLVVFFGLTSHLVYTGYVVLGLWAVALLAALIRKKEWKWTGLGFALLLATYCLTNIGLFAEILFGRAGYVSHRDEMVNYALPFWQSVKDIFLAGQHHAASCHSALILPIVILLAAGGIFYRRLCLAARQRYLGALAIFVVLALIAFFYGFCKSELVTAWRNSVSGFLHYFQAERVFWLYPSGWYLDFALAFSVWWTESRERQDKKTWQTVFCGPAALCLLFVALLYPSAHTVLYESFFYMNVNQYNNGSGVTGYIPWDSWYAEDLMAELDEAIGREKDTYRVAHLGICPAPALMYGFYTADGYSNNYSLAYKHAFRRVIAAELSKNAETASYFDDWGNRCYLFNSCTGNYWMLKKGNTVQYEGLEFDMDALADLGCEYLFSGAEIVDAEEMGLKLMGYFETENSYWGIWLYQFLRFS